MSESRSVREINVGLDFGGAVTHVGRLAMRERRIYFEYHPDFIAQGLELSPYHLPLKTGVTSFDLSLFEGLPGVFNDSLPDGWGRLLFDRLAMSRGVLPASLTPLDRLAHVGRHGLGALVFEPDRSTSGSDDLINLDQLAQQIQQVLDGPADHVLQTLETINGSSAGARPKALIGLDHSRQQIIHGVDSLPAPYDAWIVKFPNSHDGADAGAIEFVYGLMAKQAGIAMPEIHLFSAQKGAGYFAVKRFDRHGAKRTHMHTACGLLHSDFRTPSLDYKDLLDLTAALTRDAREVEKLYRLAVFNVLAHNRDDHSKNFTFLMDAKGQWTLSPAYDLTFSSGPNGEQSTMVMGEGRNPALDHLTALGHQAKLAPSLVQSIHDQTLSALSRWDALAKDHGMASGTRILIGKHLQRR